MNKQDRQWISKFREQHHNYLSHEEYMMICEIHARVFNHAVIYLCKGCDPKPIQKYINEINMEFENGK